MLFKKNCDDSFFCDVNGIKLDKYQRKAVVNNDDYLLVIAGAGSGKTLTIVGKVKYLIEKKNYNIKDILCLSFTNETVNNLKSKLNYSVDVFTFHKLALNILKDENYFYKIANDKLLSYIIDEYFKSSLWIKYRNYLYEYFDNKVDVEDKKFQLFKYNIFSFVKKIKSNALSMKDLYRLKKRIHSIKEKIFFLFALCIYQIYIEELFSEAKIDFDDMLIKATETVKRSGLKREYRYIIIDEYQDISKIRFNLICQIIKKTGAKLMCVGDDFQAIYGFSGSNVFLFLDFFKYFPQAKRIDIKNTYRNSYQLVQLSSNFVMHNKKQIRKSLYANFLLKNPVVLVYYDNNYLEVYHNLINYLYLEKKINLLVLGRFNRDLDEVKINEVKGVNIKYLTVHKSKGLECENVVLLKMSDDYLGFPAKIKNNYLFDSINDSKEDILYAEERRLFYVALTRTKERIYILVPRRNPSIFVKEIRSQCVELLFK